VEYSHSKGVYHRDIKPANILINEEDLKDSESYATIKLGDFGLSANEDIEAGTLPYRTPF